MKLLWHLWQFMQSRFLMLINHDMIRIWSQKWQPVDKCFDKIVCMPKRNSEFNLKSTLSWCDHFLPAYFRLLTIESELREIFREKTIQFNDICVRWNLFRNSWIDAAYLRQNLYFYDFLLFIWIILNCCISSCVHSQLVGWSEMKIR